MPEKNEAWKYHVALSESKGDEAARRERQFRAVIEMLVSRWQAAAKEVDRHDNDHTAG
ncbi:MAG: hypothetical protein KatS3mg114_0800 [Planctomycetaceae bacterium]|nr:MAG: hypothetical protein KatS3mg114_0800 [Planctomycetaceae bacterium]